MRLFGQRNNYYKQKKLKEKLIKLTIEIINIVYHKSYVNI